MPAAAPPSDPKLDQNEGQPLLQPAGRDRAPDGATPYHPTALSRQTGLITCLVIASVVGVMIISGLIRANNRPDRFTEAQNDLTEALAQIPFSARLPEPEPAGSRLVGVIVQAPDDNRGPSVYAIETTYTVIGDTQGDYGSARYVRIWQTNDVYLRKRALDPLAEKPDPTEISGFTWFRRNGESLERQAGVSYTTRFSDGITMVVSGPDEQLVLSTINSLTERAAS
jgi:hypothetical protein